MQDRVVLDKRTHNLRSDETKGFSILPLGYVRVILAHHAEGRTYYTPAHTKLQNYEEAICEGRWSPHPQFQWSNNK